MDTQVKRGFGAADIERMVGFTDLYGVEHPGDGVPRLMHFPETGWSLWITVERGDGEVVLTSAAVPEDVAVRLLGSTVD